MEKTKSKTYSHHPERISLTSTNLEVISRWTDKVKSELKGSRFTRSDMVNWFIEQRNADLSDKELVDIRHRFFDPQKALAWALAQLKEAQKSGQEIDVGKLVRETLVTNKKSASSPRISSGKKKKEKKPGNPPEPDSPVEAP